MKKLFVFSGIFSLLPFLGNSGEQISGTWTGYTPVYNQTYAEVFIPKKNNPNKGTGLGLYVNRNGQRTDNKFKWEYYADKLVIIYPSKPHLKSSYGRVHLNFTKKITVVYSVEWVSAKHATFKFQSATVRLPKLRQGTTFDAYRSPHEMLPDAIKWYEDEVKTPF